MSGLSFVNSALSDGTEGEPWQQLGEKKDTQKLKLKLITVLTDFFPRPDS